MRVKNDGVARLYTWDGEEYRAQLKLALLTENNQVIDTVTLKDSEGNDINPCEWTPEEYANITSEYKFEKTEGAKKLAIGIFTPDSEEKPTIRMGIECEYVDGWHIINTMPSGADTNLAYNKLYSTTYEMPEFYYGLHYDDYAFDDDLDTYWATDGTMGQNLTVDLGEEMKVSKINIVANSAYPAKITIEGRVDGNWKTMTQLSRLNAGNNEISFWSFNVDGVRLVVSGESAEAVEISEFIVME